MAVLVRLAEMSMANIQKSKLVQIRGSQGKIVRYSSDAPFSYGRPMNIESRQYMGDPGPRLISINTYA